MPRVPIGRGGPLQWKAVAGEEASEGASSVWPLFLRAEDRSLHALCRGIELELHRVVHLFDSQGDAQRA